MKYLRIILSLGIFLLFACGKKTISTKAESNDITEAVYASGKIKSAEQYQVFAPVSGVIETVKIKEGETIKLDQILFEINQNTTALNTENARLALDLSRENNSKGSEMIQEAELSVQSAKEKYMTDSSLYLKQKRLWDQKIGAEVDLENRKLAYLSSKYAWMAAQTRLDQLKTKLKNEEKRAEIGYEINQKVKSDYSVKSMIDGTVFDIIKEKGTLITPQTPLAVIGKANSFIIETDVDEDDIVKIKEGQEMLVSMDSYKGQSLNARVTRIIPFMDERSRTFKVEAVFVNPPAVLFPNLSLEANIIVRTKKNVVTIPSDYLLEGKFVLLENKEKKEVKIGLRSEGKVEILEGLQAGETIIHP